MNKQTSSGTGLLDTLRSNINGKLGITNQPEGDPSLGTLALVYVLAGTGELERTLKEDLDSIRDKYNKLSGSAEAWKWENQRLNAMTDFVIEMKGGLRAGDERLPESVKNVTSNNPITVKEYVERFRKVLACEDVFGKDGIKPDAFLRSVGKAVKKDLDTNDSSELVSEALAERLRAVLVLPTAALAARLNGVVKDNNPEYEKKWLRMALREYGKANAWNDTGSTQDPWGNLKTDAEIIAEAMAGGTNDDPRQQLWTLTAARLIDPEAVTKESMDEEEGGAHARNGATGVEASTTSTDSTDEQSNDASKSGSQEPDQERNSVSAPAELENLRRVRIVPARPGGGLRSIKDLSDWKLELVVERKQLGKDARGESEEQNQTGSGSADQERPMHRERIVINPGEFRLSKAQKQRVEGVQEARRNLIREMPRPILARLGINSDTKSWTKDHSMKLEELAEEREGNAILTKPAAPHGSESSLFDVSVDTGEQDSLDAALSVTPQTIRNVRAMMEPHVPWWLGKIVGIDQKGVGWVVRLKGPIFAGQTHLVLTEPSDIRDAIRSLLDDYKVQGDLQVGFGRLSGQLTFKAEMPAAADDVPEATLSAEGNLTLPGFSMPSRNIRIEFVHSAGRGEQNTPERKVRIHFEEPAQEAKAKVGQLRPRHLFGYLCRMRQDPEQMLTDGAEALLGRDDLPARLEGLFGSPVIHLSFNDGRGVELDVRFVSPPLKPQKALLLDEVWERLSKHVSAFGANHGLPDADASLTSTFATAALAGHAVSLKDADELMLPDGRKGGLGIEAAIERAEWLPNSPTKVALRIWISVGISDRISALLPLDLRAQIDTNGGPQKSWEIGPVDAWRLTYGGSEIGIATVTARQMIALLRNVAQDRGTVRLPNQKALLANIKRFGSGLTFEIEYQRVLSNASGPAPLSPQPILAWRLSAAPSGDTAKAPLTGDARIELHSNGQISLTDWSIHLDPDFANDASDLLERTGRLAATATAKLNKKAKAWFGDNWELPSQGEVPCCSFEVDIEQSQIDRIETTDDGTLIVSISSSGYVEVSAAGATTTLRLDPLVFKGTLKVGSSEDSEETGRLTLEVVSGRSSIEGFRLPQPDGDMVKTQLEALVVDKLKSQLYGRDLAWNGGPDGSDGTHSVQAIFRGVRVKTDGCLGLDLDLVAEKSRRILGRLESVKGNISDMREKLESKIKEELDQFNARRKQVQDDLNVIRDQIMNSEIADVLREKLEPLYNALGLRLEVVPPDDNTSNGFTMEFYVHGSDVEKAAEDPPFASAEVSVDDKNGGKPFSFVFKKGDCKKLVRAILGMRSDSGDKTGIPAPNWIQFRSCKVIDTRLKGELTVGFWPYSKNSAGQGTSVVEFDVPLLSPNNSRFTLRAQAEYRVEDSISVAGKKVPVVLTLRPELMTDHASDAVACADVAISIGAFEMGGKVKLLRDGEPEFTPDTSAVLAMAKRLVRNAVLDKLDDLTLGNADITVDVTLNNDDMLRLAEEEIPNGIKVEKIRAVVPGLPPLLEGKLELEVRGVEISISDGVDVVNDGFAVKVATGSELSLFGVAEIKNPSGQFSTRGGRRLSVQADRIDLMGDSVTIHDGRVLVPLDDVAAVGLGGRLHVMGQDIGGTDVRIDVPEKAFACGVDIGFGDGLKVHGTARIDLDDKQFYVNGDGSVLGVPLGRAYVEVDVEQHAYGGGGMARILSEDVSAEMTVYFKDRNVRASVQHIPIWPGVLDAGVEGDRRAIEVTAGKWGIDITVVFPSFDTIDGETIKQLFANFLNPGRWLTGLMSVRLPPRINPFASGSGGGGGGGFGEAPKDSFRKSSGGEGEWGIEIAGGKVKVHKRNASSELGNWPPLEDNLPEENRDEWNSVKDKLSSYNRSLVPQSATAPHNVTGFVIPDPENPESGWQISKSESNGNLTVSKIGPDKEDRRRAVRWPPPRSRGGPLPPRPYSVPLAWTRGGNFVTALELRQVGRGTLRSSQPLRVPLPSLRKGFSKDGEERTIDSDSLFFYHYGASSGSSSIKLYGAYIGLNEAGDWWENPLLYAGRNGSSPDGQLSTQKLLPLLKNPVYRDQNDSIDVNRQEDIWHRRRGIPSVGRVWVSEEAHEDSKTGSEESEGGKNEIRRRGLWRTGLTVHETPPWGEDNTGPETLILPLDVKDARPTAGQWIKRAGRTLVILKISYISYSNSGKDKETIGYLCFQPRDGEWVSSNDSDKGSDIYSSLAELQSFAHKQLQPQPEATE